MPPSPTDVPHTAFTHHRIAIHDLSQTKKPTARDKPGTLVSVYDDSHLPTIDRDRNLGLAYRLLAGDARHADHWATYRRRALALLEGVREEGLRDPDVDAALAVLWARRDSGRPAALAEGALRYDKVTPRARQDALSVLRTAFLDRSVPRGVSLADLFVLPAERFDTHSLRRVEECLRQLVRLRRDKEDWLLLGICRHVAGDEPGALDAVRRAARIAPSSPHIRRVLAVLYQRAGVPEEAARHLEAAAQLDRRPKR